MNKRNLSRVPLQSLRHLEAVVRCGTFEAAANELSVTPGAVSQHIKRLEKSLGITLFTRYGNRSVPNDRAVEIANTLTITFSDIERVLGKHTGQADVSFVKMKLYQTWATRWLIPNLERFTKLHPGIAIEFETGFGPFDPERADIDLSLQIISEGAKGVNHHEILIPHLSPVCSPQLAQKLHSIKDIVKLPRIASRNRMDDWSNWLGSTHENVDEEAPVMVFSNSTLVYETALSGNGIAIAQIELVLNDLENGRLVQPFKLTVEAKPALSLVQSVSKPQNKASRIFKEWLITEAEILKKRTNAYLSGFIR